MNGRLRYLGISAIAAALAAFALASPAYAGGPLHICNPGQPYLWPGGGLNIPYNPDQGWLGPLDNPSAVAQTDLAFQRWAGVATATATYVNAGLLPVDVDETNYLPYLYPPAPDGYSAIVYDADGAIFTQLFGPNSGVLGFSTPEWVNTITCEILEGVSFLNGGEILAGFPVAEFLSVQHHEFGHFNNLAHTVVNEEIAAYWDHTGPSPYDTFGWPVNLVGLIETMSPWVFINGGQDTPHSDDIAIFSTLYPAPGFFANTGSITGTIYAPNGTTPVTGVNVIVRNVALPFGNAYSAISSDFTDSTTPGAPYVGTYTVNGLMPGGDYVVYTDQIIAGGFSTPPALLPGPEEFWNGADESSNATTDDPSVYTTITAAAGVQASGIDIIFNTPGPGVIPLGDDDFEEIFLPFPFGYCGEEYNSVFVNSNGSLTFGAGSTLFSDSDASLLSGPPRIAGLWDDLNPSAGGIISWSATEDTVTFSFEDVPEYYSTGANTFHFTLIRAASQVELDYVSLTASDGLSGLSCGTGWTTGLETEVDLTAEVAVAEDGTINARNEAAFFEWFSEYDNDLSGVFLRFNAPNAFKDNNEPNDTPWKASRVNLPYNTEDRFTTIDPVGEDIDWFRFRADEGETLVAEVVAGNLDSLIALFDYDTGALLASDDDGGAGLLSKIVTPIPADGLYVLAMTTYPDFGLTGAGNSGGRYVLDLQTTTGFLLPLGDDDTIEVTIPDFAFPFQGSLWTSVWVNSNGNLTFGMGDTDYSESISEFLSGPPRIAPLWDDLSPNQGGQVSAEWDATSFTVHFENVPEFYSPVGNTFSVTLHASGEITVEYGATNGSDGLVGITEGNGAADPGEIDLSTSGTWPGTGTTYELFSVGGYVDLDYLTLMFIP